MRIKVVQLLDQRDMIAVNRGQADPDREFERLVSDGGSAFQD
jgi:hypothetical protein